MMERIKNALAQVPRAGASTIHYLYLARIHNAATARFYLPDWETAISRKLDIIAYFYQLLSDRVRTAQSDTLELIIIVLILAEIVMAIFR